MLIHKYYSSGQCANCHDNLKNLCYTCIQCQSPDTHRLLQLCLKCEKERHRFHPAEHVFALSNAEGRFHIKTWMSNLDKNKYKTHLEHSPHHELCSKCRGQIYGIKWVKVGIEISFNEIFCNDCFEEIPKENLVTEKDGWLKITSFFNVSHKAGDYHYKKIVTHTPEFDIGELDTRKQESSYFIADEGFESYLDIDDEKASNKQEIDESYYVYGKDPNGSVSSYINDEEYHEPVSSYINDEESHEPVSSYISDDESHDPVSSYFGEEESHEHVSSYINDEESHDPVSTYFGEEESNEPVSSYINDEESHEPVSSYIGDDESHDPVSSYFGEEDNLFESDVDGYSDDGGNVDIEESDKQESKLSSSSDNEGYFGDINFDEHEKVNANNAHKEEVPIFLGENIRNWNEEFQVLISKFKKNRTTENAIKLRKLSKEFIKIATEIGKTIIEEVSLSVSEKTIKPVSIGGIAGGEKYIKEGIFFKFAIDAFGVYGGDEFAQKAASHELLGLKAYYNTNIEGLFTPFMLLMDYIGYRLIATTLLPINKNTLIYGSADAGKTIKKTDNRFNVKMSKAAKILNIKEHKVGLDKEIEYLCAPTDIEGHLAKDGRYYILDTARVCPPEPIQKNFLAFSIPSDKITYVWEPLKDIQEMEISKLKWLEQISKVLFESENSNDDEENTFIASDDCHDGIIYFLVKGSNEGRWFNSRASYMINKKVYGNAVIVLSGRKGSQLFNLLRYELIKQLPYPVSSDAFTPFGKIDSHIHNKEVEDAFFKLLGEIIPLFARNVTPLIKNNSEAIRMIQEHGINIRFIGFLRSFIPKAIQYSPIRQWLLIEMITRSTKNYLRNKLRKASMKKKPIKNIIIKWFNLLLGNSLKSSTYWFIELKLQLMKKFGQYGQSLTPEELSIKYDLRKDFSKLVLFQTLQKKLGIEFDSETQMKFQMFPHLFEVDKPFDSDKINCFMINKHILSPEIDDFIVENIRKETNNDLEKMQKLYQDLDIMRHDLLAQILLNDTFDLLISDERESHFDKILENCKKAFSYYNDHCRTPFEVTVKAYYIIACVHFYKSEYETAYALFYAIYDLLTKVVAPPKDYDDIIEAPIPFSLLLLDKLSYLEMLRGNHNEAYAFSHLFTILWIAFPFPGKGSQIKPYFDRRIPFALSLNFSSANPLEVVEQDNLLSEEKKINKYDTEKWINDLIFRNTNAGDIFISPKVIEQYIEQKIHETIIEKCKGQLLHEFFRSLDGIKATPIINEDDQKLKLWIQLYREKYILKDSSLVFVNTEKMLYSGVPTFKTEDIYMKMSLTRPKDIIDVDFNFEEGSYICVLVNNRMLQMPDISFRGNCRIFHCIHPKTKHILISVDLTRKWVNWFQEWNNKKIKEINLYSIDENNKKVSIIDENGIFWIGDVDLGPVLRTLLRIQGDRTLKKHSKLDTFTTISACISTHSLVLLSNGNIYAEGNNQYGQLGLGDSIDRDDPKLVHKLKGANIVHIACGKNISVAVDDLGKIYQWGKGYGLFPELHPFFDKQKIEIAKVVCQLHESEEDCVFKESVCYITKDGIVYFWDTTYEKDEEPTPILSIEDFCIDVAITASNMFILTSKGEIYVTGYYSKGSSGLGYPHPLIDPKMNDKYVFNNFRKIDSLEGIYIVKVLAIQHRTMAIDEFGNLYIWGESYYNVPTKFDTNYKAKEISACSQELYIHASYDFEKHDRHPKENEKRGVVKGERYFINVIRDEESGNFRIQWETKHLSKFYVSIVGYEEKVKIPEHFALLSLIETDLCYGELLFSFSNNICGIHEVICPLKNGKYVALILDENKNELYRSNPFFVMSQCSFDLNVKISPSGDDCKILYSRNTPPHKNNCIAILDTKFHQIVYLQNVGDYEKGMIQFIPHRVGEYEVYWYSKLGNTDCIFTKKKFNCDKAKAQDIDMIIQTPIKTLFAGTLIDVEWTFECSNGTSLNFGDQDKLYLFNMDLNELYERKITPKTMHGVVNDFKLPNKPGIYQWRYQYLNKDNQYKDIEGNILIITKNNDLDLTSTSLYFDKDMFTTWEEFFQMCQFNDEEIDLYTIKMIKNNIKISNYHLLDSAFLKDFGIPLHHIVIIIEKIHQLKEERLRNFINTQIDEKIKKLN